MTLEAHKLVPVIRNRSANSLRIAISSFIGIDSAQTVRAASMNIPPLANNAVPNAERCLQAKGRSGGTAALGCPRRTPRSGL